MKKICLFALVISLMAFSCEKEEGCFSPDNTCKVSNPAVDLAWLKTEIQRREQNTSEERKYFYIQQAEYHQQPVFLFNNCCPNCDTLVPVFNCQGEQIFILGQNPEEDKKLKNVKMLWKTTDFACVL